MSTVRRRQRGGIGAVLAGLLFIYLGHQVGQAHREAMDGAQPMQATVVSTAVEREVDTGPEQGVRVTFYPRVSYRYTIDGETFRNDAIWPATARGGESDWAEGFIDDYPVGSRVAGWYRPASPQQSFLVKGLPWLSWMAIGLGAIFLAIGVVDLLRRSRGRT